MKNQPTIDTVYLDMDGVLSDFMAKYRELNGEWKRDQEGRKSDAWKNFCEGGHFARLATWPGAFTLTSYLDVCSITNHFKIEILTSSGGPDHHDQVAADKQAWCDMHGLPYKVNVVPGRWLKKDWASPTALLIDDTEDVIDSWRAAGGIGILHRDAGETIKEVAKLLDRIN